MIRAIVLLLILAALAVLAVQNLSTSVALVILSSRTGEIPFGLLLVGAVGVGALISLILYGLLSLLRRSPESKYQPLGRRVPYPESPRDAAQPVSSSPYQPEAPYGSAAFVSEPAAVPQDSTPDPSATKYSDMPPEAAYRPSPLPQPAPEKKKSPPRSDSDRNRSSGDDWGEARTAAQRESWDEGGGPADGGQKRGLFDFIRPDSGRSNAAQLTDDIAEGWNEPAARYEYPAGYLENDARYESGYDDGSERGWEPDSYDEAPPDPAYERRVYRDGLYGEDDFFEEGVYADENRPGEMGPDGVYEADYRVITPPSQPLDDDEDKDYS